jgi:ABC-2 type transport system permease protein
LAHLCVDALTIPILCLSLWSGNWLGNWLLGPIEVRPLPATPSKPAYLVELGPFKIRLENPRPAMPSPNPETADRLAVRPSAFGPALFVVGGLLFAVSGATMCLSAAGRFRWRVLGFAVLIALVQFLVNLIGQMWEAMEPLRPLTIFYYYQPQQIILGHDWSVTLREWNGGERLFSVPMPLVLYGVGLLGYGLALWTFNRRDLPAPL